MQPFFIQENRTRFAIVARFVDCFVELAFYVMISARW